MLLTILLALAFLARLVSSTDLLKDTPQYLQLDDSKSQDQISEGRVVGRLVPSEYLPPEGTTKDIYEAHYRLIGRDLRHDDQRLASAIDESFAKLQARPLHVTFKLDLLEGSLIPGASALVCSQDIDRDTCFLRSFKSAEHYRSIDMNVRIGVSRSTTFPEIGGSKWTYNRMFEAELRGRGYVARIVLKYFKIVPHNVNIVKHIPLTPLYAEQTVFELEGRGLLPFTLAKQNLLLASLDTIGVTSQLGMGWMDLFNVSQAQRWSPSHNDFGSVNFTIVSARSQFDGGSMGEVLQTALPKLLKRLDMAGMPCLRGRVFYSRPISGHSLQDQIIQILDKNDTTRTFDTRDSRPPIPSYPLPLIGRSTSVELLYSVIVIIGVTLFVCGRIRKQRCKTIPEFLFSRKHSASWVTRLAGLPIPNDQNGSSFLSEDDKGDSMASQTSESYDLSVNPFQRERGLSDSSKASSIVKRRIGENMIENNRIEGAGKEVDSSKHGPRKLDYVERLRSWEISADAISICRRRDGKDWLLGKGAYGQVYKGVRGGVQNVAVKVMTYSEDLEAQRFWLEIRLLRSLSYDRNVVQFYGCVLHERYPILVMELMEGGNLWSALHGPRSEDFSWYERGQSIAMGIVRGLFYLHDNRVIHGDLKSKNVLLTEDAMTAKLSDMGMSQILATSLGSMGLSNAPPGTFTYAAPELILGKRCTFKADIFSLGVLLWEICTHETPRRGHLRELRVPADCPERISNLIERCILADPAERPSIREVFDALRCGCSNGLNESCPKKSSSRDRIEAEQIQPSQLLRPAFDNGRIGADHRAEHAGNSEAYSFADIKVKSEKIAELKSWVIPADSIELCRDDNGNRVLIQEQCFGQVYKGLRSGVQDIAVQLMTYPENMETQLFWAEVGLLKSVSADCNIVQFYGCVPDKSHPMLIFEYMEGGNLWSALNGPNSDDFYWYKKSHNLALDVTRGLSFLHDQGRILGYLKPKWIQLTKDAMNAKLSFVGVASLVPNLLHPVCFTQKPPANLAYTAPEVMQGQACTLKSDIFSLGVTLWEMCTHITPSIGQMRDLKVPDECPRAVAELICQCQAANPDDRPNIKHIFNVLKTQDSLLIASTNAQ